MLGAKIKLDVVKNVDLRIDEILFGEAPSRIVVSLNKDNLNALEKIAEKHSVPLQVLGNVGGEKLTVEYRGKTVIDLALTKLSATWRNAIPSRLK
jgi:phosphoribosylformylglycinamidine synthase